MCIDMFIVFYTSQERVRRTPMKDKSLQMLRMFVSMLKDESLRHIADVYFKVEIEIRNISHATGVSAAKSSVISHHMIKYSIRRQHNTT